MFFGFKKVHFYTADPLTFKPQTLKKCWIVTILRLNFFSVSEALKIVKCDVKEISLGLSINDVTTIEGGEGQGLYDTIIHVLIGVVHKWLHGCRGLSKWFCDGSTKSFSTNVMTTGRGGVKICPELFDIIYGRPPEKKTSKWFLLIFPMKEEWTFEMSRKLIGRPM